MPTAADEGYAPSESPVRVVADARLAVGPGVLPLYLSHDWSRPLPAIDRAVIVLHGRRRDADTYLQAAETAAAGAGSAADGSLLIVPQFLAVGDVRHHGLPPDMLHWTLESWMGGEPAEGPAPLSSFEALDAILARLSDPALFPNLRTVVVAGHSGGGQVAQRYAVLGLGGDLLQAAGLKVRYVVANPSSYVYFGPDRPGPIADCAGFDRWKYGMNGLPPYAGSAAPVVLEAAYVGREVVYLWGGGDVDPEQPALDRSCAGMTQGPHRLARGKAYLAHLKARHPDLAHTAAIVPGVGHDGAAMFGSAAGLAALFDKQ
jgi:pimeloyl-ACP methyl ester carboxylesterase